MLIGVHKIEHDVSFSGAGEEARLSNMGILVADGTYWQALRQAWQAMFHPDRCLLAECSFYTVLTIEMGRHCG